MGPLYFNKNDKRGNLRPSLDINDDIPYNTPNCILDLQKTQHRITQNNDDHN